jgi:hypothetical protein
MFTKNYEEMLDPISFVQVVRATANWCNGNLMSISRQRLRDQRIKEIEDRAENENSTVDTDVEREYDPTNSTELGFVEPLSLMKRGDCFASIRQAAFNIALEKNWKGFDVPRDMKGYMENRIRTTRLHVPSQAEIRNKSAGELVMDEAEAKAWLIESYAKQAALLEQDSLSIITEDNAYETSIDPEEALSKLGIGQEYRLRIKFIDSLMYEYYRMEDMRQRYGDKFANAKEKGDMFLIDADTLSEDFKVWEKSHQQEIHKYYEDREMIIPEIAERHRLLLRKYRIRLQQRISKT